MTAHTALNHTPEHVVRAKVSLPPALISRALNQLLIWALGTGSSDRALACGFAVRRLAGGGAQEGSGLLGTYKLDLLIRREQLRTML